MGGTEMTTATLKNNLGTADRVAKAKNGIEIGLRVLASIAEKHKEFGADVETAKIEILTTLEHDGVFKASRLAWRHIETIGEKAASTEMAKAGSVLESVNGYMPQRKAEATRFLNEAKTDYEGRNYREAAFKAGRARGILEAIQRDSQANAEYAQSLRQSNWGVLEELKLKPKQRKKR